MSAIKLSDYVAGFLSAHGINQVFMVVGGGAMHLDDSFARRSDLNILFNHHEQACSMAAESYARIAGIPACVCVTTGPGGINAMTGVAGAYLDSIPMLVISGQVRYDTTLRSTGLPIRSVGDQEFDITRSADAMTKYSHMVTSPDEIRRVLEKAYHLAITGRPGPCWIDIPVDIQAAVIDPDMLEGYDPSEDAGQEPPKVSADVVTDVIKKIRDAARPVLYAGNGIRISGAHDVFLRVADKLGIPVVTCWDSIDAICDDHPLYTGRGGIMGDRAGNYAVQNADLVLAIGNRLSIRQVGYEWQTWAPHAYVIDVDIDRYEPMKHTVHVDMPIWADAGDFLLTMEEALDACISDQSNDNDEPSSDTECQFRSSFDGSLYHSKMVKMKLDIDCPDKSRELSDACDDILSRHPDMLRFQKRPSDWLSLCSFWKKAYPVITEDMLNDKGLTNVYALIGELGRQLHGGETIVVGNGSACVVGSHAFPIKDDQRFIINSAIASMGYDLPAAIGACKALGGQEVILITGDGSIQMNLQELQTIITNNMNIKIFIINNNGYHSIRQTQTHLFEKNFVGIGPESGGLSFPDMSKILTAYGYSYYDCHSNAELDAAITQTLETTGYAACEVFCSLDQFFEPKSAAMELPDGTLMSPPLDDLAPFLSRLERDANTCIV